MRLVAAILALLAVAPVAHAETAVASWYGRESGPKTASGERFNPAAMTAAHRTLPFGTLVQVTYRGRSVVVRINDRGPFVRGRSIDLSEGAAKRIGLDGVGTVEMHVVSAPYQPKHGDWGSF